MTEWWQDERRLRIHFFCSLPKSLSFLLIPSFPFHSRMPKNENEERRDVSPKTSHSFSLHSHQFHHSRMSQNDGMRVKWVIFLKQGKTLNSEIFLILPSFGHSSSISSSSHDHSIHLRIIPHSDLIPWGLQICCCLTETGMAKWLRNEQDGVGTMTEWQNDSRMRDISEFSFFAHFQNHPHSSSFRHLDVILECQGMKMKKGGMSFIRHPIHFHSIPISFVIQECLGMTGWGWNEGDFWTKAKPLILKSPSFSYHSVIPFQNPFLHMTIPFIRGPFLIQI